MFSAAYDLTTRTPLFELIDSSPVGVFHTDAAGLCIYTNQVWQEIYGLDLQQSIGHRWSQTIHLDDLSWVLAKWQSSVDRGESFLAEFRINNPKGKVTVIRSRANPVLNDKGVVQGFVGSVEDITCYTTQYQREQCFNTILNMILERRELQDIFTTIVNCVENENPDMLCSILLLDKTGQYLIHGAAPSLPKFYIQALNNMKIGADSASCGTAAYTGNVVIVENIQTDPLWQDYKKLAAQAGLQACFSVPMKDRFGNLLGTFAIYHRYPCSADEADIAVVKTVAQLATIAIERKQAEENSLNAYLYLQSTIDGLSSHICLLDESGKIILVNRAWREFSYNNQGNSLKTLEGVNYLEYCDRVIGEDVNVATNFANDLRAVLAGNKEFFDMEYACHSPDEQRWFVVRVSRCVDNGDARAVVAHENITNRKLAEKNIWNQANFDSLTGLPNRHMFIDRLVQEIKKDQREQLPFALLYIDLDHFKDVNDTLGHDMGDVLLIEAARRIKNCLRDADTVARIGGDEFTVILTGMYNPSAIERVAKNLIDVLSAPFKLDEELLYVSASIGIVLYPDDAVTSENLLKYADQAMYVAKKAGRNCYSFFTYKLQEAAGEYRQLIADLRIALQQNQFQIHYQPIVNLTTGDIYKAEALIRWNHPLRGLVSPMDFIPLAEETGLIIEIGDWVFKQAAQQVKKWQRSIHPHFKISVNKSPVQFHDTHKSDHHLWPEYLNHLEIAAESIIIEITEGLLLDNDAIVRDKIKKFNDAGIRFAMDDFGTGYSAMAYLKKFDIDYIKIDQSFVRNLEDSVDNLALCEAIIVMAHKLGMKVIAEGVETEAQRQFLYEAGCDYGQGYLFMRPVPATEFEKAFIK